MVHECVRFTLWQLTIKIITMSKINLTYNKVYNYVKGKSVVELIFEFIAFGILAPMAFGGIAFMIFMLATGQVTEMNIACGICD